MPPPARIPAPSIHPVFIWPTPERQDELFYVEKDGNLPKNKGWDHGDAHPDTNDYPDHKLIHVTPQDGKNWSKWYYAKNRTVAEEEAYNWEYHQADLGGRKFDGIRRTYLTPRASFSATVPAAGAANPDVPAGMFTGYILATREQRRTGDAIFDSLYVIEVRDYVSRVGISASSYDQSTHGVLVRTETLYYRGEIYNVGAAIEVEILDETKWGVSSGGVQTEASQLSNDWFLVTSTDVIPKNKTITGGKFGGKVLQAYDTYITYSWPSVLGTDGSLNHLGAAITGSIEITSWEDKGGTIRNIPRPMFKEHGYRGPTRATIIEEWSLTNPTLAGDAERPYHLRPRPLVYITPFLVVKIPPSLHAASVFIADTGTEDPTWGQNVGSQRTFPATNRTDWPASFTAFVEVTPFRGGYITRHVTVHKPEEIPVP